MVATRQKTKPETRVRKGLRRLGRRLRPSGAEKTSTPRWPLDYGLHAPGGGIHRHLSPVSGQEIRPGLKIFHDANPTAPFDCVLRPSAAEGRLVLTCYGIDAGYVSLVAGVPGALATDIRPHHRLSLDLSARASRPLHVYLRLNLSADDRHEVMHEAFILDTGDRHAGFDLGGVDLAFGERLSVWLDIILNAPAMSEVRIDTLALSLEGGK